MVSQIGIQLSAQANASRLGAPGAGKGTLTKKLARKYGFKHLSIGDLLRQIVASPNADDTVVEYVRRGELLTTEMLFPILKPHVDAGGITILDGFPRHLDQAKEFEQEVRLDSSGDWLRF